MSVKARVMAGLVSFLDAHSVGAGLTAYLHLAPQLRLALFALLVLTGSFHTCLGRRTAAVALYRDLASVDIAVCLHRALSIILSRVCDTRRR